MAPDPESKVEDVEGSVLVVAWLLPVAVEGPAPAAPAKLALLRPTRDKVEEADEAGWYLGLLLLQLPPLLLLTTPPPPPEALLP